MKEGKSERCNRCGNVFPEENIVESLCDDCWDEAQEEYDAEYDEDEED